MTPDVPELLEVLAVHGIPESAVHAALAEGPEWFASTLAIDGDAWARYVSAFNALRGLGGYVSPDEVTVGAIVWTFVAGDAFTSRITSHLAS